MKKEPNKKIKFKYNNTKGDYYGFTDLDIIEIYTDILRNKDEGIRTKREVEHIKNRFLKLIK